MLRTTLKLGLAGTGIFARKAHGPAIRGNRDLQLAAVFSRSAENARAFAREFVPEPRSVAIFDSYDAFLRSDDFTAVDLVLPPQALSECVTKALAAGKHVLSEKPIAGTAREGQQMIKFWRMLEFRTAWLVSENWRLEQSFLDARRHLEAGAIGLPMRFLSTCMSFRRPDSPYLQSAWRNASGGDWLTDTGTHAIAAVRTLFGARMQVTTANRIRREVPPCWTETVSASILIPGSKLPGEIAFVSAVGTDLQTGFNIRIEVVGTEGMLIVDRHSLLLCDEKGNKGTEWSYDCLTVNKSLEMFVKAIRNSELIDRLQPLHPESALEDLTTIEAICDFLIV